ncbi:hypothetical protein FSP39_002991, partial [Pinctada imbricata]
GKRKRVPNTRQNTSKFTETPSFTNFSEFDDYSLVISSPSKNEGNSLNVSPRKLRSHKKDSLHVKTSTPCTERTQCNSLISDKKDLETSTPNAKRTRRTPLSDIHNSNLSHIDHLEESIDVSPACSKPSFVSELAGDSIIVDLTKSPILFHSDHQISIEKDPKLHKASPVIQLLQESFGKMHVTLRSGRVKTLAQSNMSESLFSSINETEPSEAGAYLTADEEKDCSQSEEEDESVGEKEEDEEEEEEEEEVEEESEEEVEDDSYEEKEEEGANLSDIEEDEEEQTDEEEGENSGRLNSNNDTCYMLGSECDTDDGSVYTTANSSSSSQEVSLSRRKSLNASMFIIPIEGNFLVNDEKQKTFEEILPEIVISQELSLLRMNDAVFSDNFCEVRGVTCVQGSYPPHLLKEWDKFDDKMTSENDRPDVFKDNQLFILFEFADGGKSLESCQLSNVLEARSVLTQTAFSLAAAEEALEFEHRDLHWGNVLVKPTKEHYKSYKLLGREFEVLSHGVDVCIIDFTLSRLKKDGSVVYIDLSTDDSLFEGTGDYQFDIYRKMKEENKNDWSMFHPRSNVFWLHYLADKLIRSKRYKRNNKSDQAELRRLRNFTKDILEFNSACELVMCSDYLTEMSAS